MKVAKFGGTSMANSASIACVADIIKADSDRKFVVVSAPGKREKTDTKVTDLLYACFSEKEERGTCDTTIKIVKERFDDIISGLNITLDMSQYFDQIENDINNGESVDYVASRGEYLSAIVFAKFIGYEFIDASELIIFDENGSFDSERTNSLCAKRLAKSKGAVIPGFYGKLPDGSIKTFSRGGSDVTGSIIARAVKADLYENFTDVDGFMTCDPRIVKNPTKIPILTYRELRELSYMGANVLHPDSIFPVRKNDIPINIKNTFNPNHKGTMIVPTSQFHKGLFPREQTVITGIAGKKDFVSILIEKSMMNNELGFARKVLSVLENFGVSMEHMPSGIDTMSLIVEKSALKNHLLDDIVEELKATVSPDSIEIFDGLALIAIVGHGMARKKGTAQRVCGSLTKADINIRMIDQGSSEMNIIVAVENSDYENAIRALYGEFFAN